MITGKCDICAADIAPGADQARFNRNLALHKRMKHGIASPKHEAYQKYKASKAAKAVDSLGRVKPKLTAARLAQLDAARNKRWAQYRQGTKPFTPAEKAARERLGQMRNKSGINIRNHPALKGLTGQAYKTMYNRLYRQAARRLPADKAKQRAYKRRWYQNNKRRTTQPQPEPQGNGLPQVTPCKLDTCPNCGSRFYVTVPAIKVS